MRRWLDEVRELVGTTRCECFFLMVAILWPVIFAYHLSLEYRDDLMKTVSVCSSNTAEGRCLATSDPDLPGSVVHYTMGSYLIGWCEGGGGAGPETGVANITNVD